ncbi:MAG: hypothetical protein AAB719_01390 [Patescibacteria group bacterium]
MPKAKSNKLGEVNHWYDKISVAVIKLNKALKVGDEVKFKRGDKQFSETISSMQLDHEPVKSGKKGDEVAVKLSQSAKEGTEVYAAD